MDWHMPEMDGLRVRIPYTTKTHSLALSFSGKRDIEKIREHAPCTRGVAGGGRAFTGHRDNKRT